MTLMFDILLILALLWLAWQALGAPDLFKGVVLYIAFGLLLALAWVRLNAPDLALVEAAIASGLTGALLLSTLGRLSRMDSAERDEIPTIAEESRAGWVVRLARGVSLAGMTVWLGWTVFEWPRPAPGLADTVQGRLAESGVSNPVTAVLLNFRSFDTLLEIGVLLLALVGVWALTQADLGTRNPPQRPGAGKQDLRQAPAVAGLDRPNPDPQFSAVPQVQVALVNLLVPVMCVTAGYLLWIGTSAPGGAFQAGAVLGGAGVLLFLSRPGLVWPRDRWWLRAGLVAGLGLFLAVGLALLLGGRRLLEYPVEWSGPLILIIEVAATVSIGLTLALLFVGGRPWPTVRQAAPGQTGRDR